jgi:hypothetical protein
MLILADVGGNGTYANVQPASAASAAPASRR